MVWNPDIEGIEQVAGYAVDAETGEIVQEVTAGVGGESQPQSRSALDSGSTPAPVGRSMQYVSVLSVAVIGLLVLVRSVQRRRT